MLRVAKNLWCSLLEPGGQDKPKTPVRWLCQRTFCYLARVQSVQLDALTHDHLCRGVELGVFLNRYFDRKTQFNAREYRAMRKALPKEPTERYLHSLKELEQNRPLCNDWCRVFDYRRAVLWVSLHYLFQLAQLAKRDILLPICSLIQLTDDVLDRKLDEELGLPTFVTAPGPAPRQLAREFWMELKMQRGPGDFPIVLGGLGAYLLCRFVILCSRN